MHINDLIHKDEPCFSSHQELSSEFNIERSFLQVLQLWSAIPCKWKRLLLGPGRQDLIVKPLIKAPDRSLLHISDVPAKKVYKPFFLVNSQKSLQAKWNETYPTNVEDPKEYWRQIYVFPFHATRESRLQSFQFKIMHRTIPCNRYQRNIRIRQDDNCSFCDPPVSDTLQHFFYSCPKAATFWHAVTQWLATQANFHILVSEKHFLLGVPKEIPQARMMNFIILLAKNFIFRQKLFNNANLELLHFLGELRNKLAVENFICTQAKKQYKFKQWNSIYKALG